MTPPNTNSPHYRDFITGRPGEPAIDHDAILAYWSGRDDEWCLLVRFGNDRIGRNAPAPRYALGPRFLEQDTAEFMARLYKENAEVDAVPVRYLDREGKLNELNGIPVDSGKTSP